MKKLNQHFFIYGIGILFLILFYSIGHNLIRELFFIFDWEICQGAPPPALACKDIPSSVFMILHITLIPCIIAFYFLYSLYNFNKKYPLINTTLTYIILIGIFTWLSFIGITTFFEF